MWALADRHTNISFNEWDWQQDRQDIYYYTARVGFLTDVYRQELSAFIELVQYEQF